MKKLVFLFASVLMLHLFSCSKGEVGVQGEKGDQGIAGIDGTKILSGSGLPAANIGAIGDFYLQTGSSVLFGPKTGSGWGSGSSLKGATGAKGSTGAAGTRLLSGTAAPTTSVGAVGDFYFQTSTGILFGAKTSSGWGSGTSLKGPKGDKGDTGNANVIMYQVGPRTSSGGYTNIDLPVSKAIRDKSTVLVYISNNGSVWRYAPSDLNGNVAGAVYNYVTKMSFGAISLSNTNTRITLSFWNPVTYSLYTTPVTLYVRIAFIEATQMTHMARKGVDIKDFDQVKATLNL
ncbi:hypothetical protein GCM10027051_35180 [Niabella terrae]